MSLCSIRSQLSWTMSCPLSVHDLYCYFTNVSKTSQGASQWRLWPNTSKNGTATAKSSNQSSQPATDWQRLAALLLMSFLTVKCIDQDAMLKYIGQIISLCMCHIFLPSMWVQSSQHIGINSCACTLLSCSYAWDWFHLNSEAKQNIHFWIRKALSWKEPEFHFSLYPCIYNMLYNSGCILNSP